MVAYLWGKLSSNGNAIRSPWRGRNRRWAACTSAPRLPSPNPSERTISSSQFFARRRLRGWSYKLGGLNLFQIAYQLILHFFCRATSEALRHLRNTFHSQYSLKFRFELPPMAHKLVQLELGLRGVHKRGAVLDDVVLCLRHGGWMQTEELDQFSEIGHGHPPEAMSR